MRCPITSTIPLAISAAVLTAVSSKGSRGWFGGGHTDPTARNFMIRWGDRVGKGVRTAPRDALLADSTSAGRRGLAFGLHRAADTAGAVIGIAVSIWVVRQVQGGGGAPRSGDLPKPGPVESGARVSGRSGPCGRCPRCAYEAGRAKQWRRGTGRCTGPGRRRGGPRLRLRGLGRGFAAFVTCSVVFELGNSADAFLVLRAQEPGLSVVGILWLLLAFNVVYTLVSTPAGSLADRIPRKRMVAGRGVSTRSSTSASRSPIRWRTSPSCTSCTDSINGLVAGLAKALVADLVPAARRGTAYGGYAAAIGFATVPASLLAGVLWEGLFAWQGFGPAAPDRGLRLLQAVGWVSFAQASRARQGRSGWWPWLTLGRRWCRSRPRRPIFQAETSSPPRTRRYNR